MSSIPPSTNFVGELATLAVLALSGAAVGIGKSLVGDRGLTLRIVVGRALVSSGLGVSAGSILTLIPELPLVGLVGIACLSASLGLSGLEHIFDKWMEAKGGPQK